MSKHRLLIPILILFTATLFSHAEAEADSWRGYLIDKECASIKIKNNLNPKLVLQRHPTDCAVKRRCSAKGYSIYVDGKWFDLDDTGNALAVKLLRASKRKHGSFVEVAGILKIEPVQAIEVGANSKVTVTTISEKRSIETVRIDEISEPPSKWSI